MTIQNALEWGEKLLKQKNIQTSQLDAELILGFILSQKKEWLIAHSQQSISKRDFKKFKKLILRRSKFEPVAYFIGKKEFYGLDFKVNRNILIPRPETEILIEAVLKEITKCYPLHSKPYFIADIGTGSGNIAITLAKQLAPKRALWANQQIAIYAADICKKALKIARENAKRHQVLNKIKFLQSNLFAKFPKNLKFDIICANLPYLKSSQITKELKSEPRKALAGGKSGLEIYQKFFQKVQNYLKSGAKIFIEINPEQKNQIKKIIKKQLPKAKIKTIKDLMSLERIIIISNL